MKQCCPPHTFPHVLPWKPKIANEPCHTHKNRARRFLHDFHCWLMQCPYRNWR
ncbi:MAG TPA: hypothetical protein HA362_05225 [Nanoarchaeota archaeon]|nr:hypothetical protein [Nanoarchaeota archaeon]